MSGSIHSRMPAEEYFAIDALSITHLKELRRSPLHYRYAGEHPKETPALALGTAAHTATLEPERFERQFASWDRRSKSGNLCPRNGKWWDAFLQANVGKEILTEDQYLNALAIAAAVRADPIAKRYLEAGEPEVVMTWSMGGRDCKGRVDWMTSYPGDVPTLVGLKSARDCRPFIFGSAAAKLGYHLQWGYYFNGFSIIRDGVKPRMVEIVVESTPPHAVVVYRIPDDVLLQGEEEFQQLMTMLAICEREGSWPGPATVEQDLTLPSWVYQADNDISELGLEG